MKGFIGFLRATKCTSHLLLVDVNGWDRFILSFFIALVASLNRFITIYSCFRIVYLAYVMLAYNQKCRCKIATIKLIFWLYLWCSCESTPKTLIVSYELQKFVTVYVCRVSQFERFGGNLSTWWMIFCMTKVEPLAKRNVAGFASCLKISHWPIISLSSFIHLF